MSVYMKLMKIQGDLKAPKGQYNSFGKYAYRNCEDIMEALKPLLVENKATIFISDEIINIPSTGIKEYKAIESIKGFDNKFKDVEVTKFINLDRYYVQATVTFVDCETGETIVNKALAREEESKKGMDGSQVTGASSSYARKYALNGMFAIDDTKDSDSTNTHGKEEKKTEYKQQNNSKLSEGQIKRLFAIASSVNVTMPQVKAGALRDYKVKNLEDLTKVQYDELIAKLEAKKN